MYKRQHCNCSELNNFQEVVYKGLDQFKSKLFISSEKKQEIGSVSYKSYKTTDILTPSFGQKYMYQKRNGQCLCK